jgi:hypothetical protein
MNVMDQEKKIGYEESELMNKFVDHFFPPRVLTDGAQRSADLADLPCRDVDTSDTALCRSTRGQCVRP